MRHLFIGGVAHGTYHEVEDSLQDHINIGEPILDLIEHSIAQLSVTKNGGYVKRDNYTRIHCEMSFERPNTDIFALSSMLNHEAQKAYTVFMLDLAKRTPKKVPLPTPKKVSLVRPKFPLCFPDALLGFLSFNKNTDRTQKLIDEFDVTQDELNLAAYMQKTTVFTFNECLLKIVTQRGVTPWKRKN